MRGLKLLLTVGVLVLGLTVATVALADNPGEGTHRLLVAEDLSPFADAHTMIPERPFGKEMALHPGAVTGWEEARSIVLLISSRKPGETAALVSNRSYKFLAPQEAQAALRSAQDPGMGVAWMTGTEDVFLSDQGQRQSLAARSSGWRAWQGIDDEGLLLTVLRIQFGSYISEVQLTVVVGNELFGQGLLNHIIDRLMADPSKRQAVAPAPSSPSPQWWGAGARADSIEETEDGHYLAVWNEPYGYSPHYWGTGGDDTTCLFGGEHGCISNWTWWLSSPQSKLGVPTTFWILAALTGSHDANNYSATVWME